MRLPSRQRTAIVVALVVLVLVATLTVQPPAWPRRPAPARVVPCEYVVAFRRGIAPHDRDVAHRAAHAWLVRRVDPLGVDLVQTADPPADVIAAYRARREVVYVEPNYVVQAAVIPNDPLYAGEWAMPKIRAPEAWSQTTGDPAIVVAIVDSGVDPALPDFAGRLVAGWNVLAQNDQPWDDNGHGTHVASIALASGGDGVGVAGVTWRSRLMPVKVLGPDGIGDTVGAAAGIRWAVDHGARIVNMSWGTLADAQVLADAIADARARGVVLVAAAGNLATAAAFYPAAYDGVLGVAATDQNDQIASFSNAGVSVDLAAPGVDIVGDAPGGGSAVLSGTSMAAPHVSGAAALILARDPTLRPDQVGQRLTASAADLGPLGWDSRSGAGRLDLAAALAGTTAPSTPRVFLPLVLVRLD